MGNRIVLLVPYENAKEDYEDRVAIVTRARNMVHNLKPDRQYVPLWNRKSQRTWKREGIF